MDKVQKPSNFECYTPWSEPFRIYYLYNFGASEANDCGGLLHTQWSDLMEFIQPQYIVFICESEHCIFAMIQSAYKAI
jgi:hypothetical protein